VTRTIGVAGFALIALAIVLVDVLARMDRIPTRPLTEVVDRLRSRLPGRLLVLAVWGFAGWHFFVRATR
jgi:hypothetical protein